MSAALARDAWKPAGLIPIQRQSEAVVHDPADGHELGCCLTHDDSAGSARPHDACLSISDATDDELADWLEAGLAALATDDTAHRDVGFVLVETCRRSAKAFTK